MYYYQTNYFGWSFSTAKLKKNRNLDISSTDSFTRFSSADQLRLILNIFHLYELQDYFAIRTLKPLLFQGELLRFTCDSIFP